jgi:anti-sigma-K factor RskA
MKQIASALAILLLAAPAFAAEPMIQFSVSDWKKAVHKIELDQQEAKLLRQQNKDLKQLVTLTTEQAQQCEQLTKSYDEMGAMSDEYRRSLEAENAQLGKSVRGYRWIVGGQAVVIGVLVWMFW